MMRKLLVLCTTIALAACADEKPSRVDDDRDAAGEESPRSDASRGDAAPDERPRDASRDANASDAGRGASSDDDGGRANPSDGGLTRDAGDARSDDASASGDAAANDAGAGATWQARSCGAATSFPSPLPPSGSRTAQRVGSERFGFLEGPVWIADLGVLLFSDINMSGGNAMGPPARIRRLTPPMTFDVFAESGNSNGLAWFGGSVFAASHDIQSLSTFDPTTGARTDLKVRYQGKRFNSPNDLAIRSDGTIYFTDPDWQLGARTSEIGKMGVYRVPPTAGGDMRAAELIEDGLDKPNGIALSPDERTLYVGSRGNEIWKYTVAADGSVSGRTKFAEVGPSDGMTVDCAGNLYVTSGTVEVLAPSGMKLGDITTAEGPTNVAFGGADAKTLYITAQTGLYSIVLAVPGAPY